MFFCSWQLGMFCQDQWKLGQWLKDSRIPTKKSVMKCTAGLFRFILQGENMLVFSVSQLEKLNWKTKYFCRQVEGEKERERHGGGRTGPGRLSVLNRSEPWNINVLSLPPIFSWNICPLSVSPANKTGHWAVLFCVFYSVSQAVPGSALTRFAASQLKINDPLASSLCLSLSLSVSLCLKMRNNPTQPGSHRGREGGVGSVA